MTQLSGLIKDYPRWADAYFTKALAHMNLGETELALGAMTEAIKYEPRNSKYHASLAFLHYKNQDAASAKKEASIALQLEPRNFPAALLLAKSILMAKDFDTAVKIFEDMRSKIPDNAEVIGNLGLAYLGKKETDKALQAFEHLLAKQPANTLALMHIARIQQEQGKSKEEIIQLVRDQIKAAPESAGNLVLLATMLSSDHQFDEALELLKKAQQIDPQNPRPYSMSATILKQQKKTNDAITEYEKLLETGSSNIQAYMGLGALYEQRGDLELAKKQYQEVLKLNGNFAPAANNLAWMLAEEAQPDLGEALRLALTAKQALPDDVHIIDTLGWVHYKRGSFSLARNEFVQAVEKQPDMPVFLYHLALALYGEEKKTEALEMLQEALAKEQPFNEREQAENLLKKWQNN